jgi:adenylosuccinate lyase
VQRNAMRSYDEQKDFKQLLLADKDVCGVLDRATIDASFDLAVQLRHVGQIIDRVFASAATPTVH